MKAGRFLRVSLPAPDLDPATSNHANPPAKTTMLSRRISQTCPSATTYNILRRHFSQTTHRTAKIPFRVSGTGSGVAQAVKTQGSPHSIQTDAYPAFGGADSAPSPLHYNLTALSSCTQVTGSIVAKDHGIALREWQVRVNGVLDPAVLVAGEQGNANWESIEVVVGVRTDAKDDAVFERFAEETERRCPVTQLFKRSGVVWKSEWKQI
ncbi:OsmC-like protein [Teratosphaeria nubilosa]|uniref:OsmC-like protein n=1 Tax=Teratosphaeria nubilosa TaxID=161662 RepID=A0A6G1L9D4_9PEZI|nr:OsmC-like protein [Teratosphaeria nubilosa]